MKQKEKLLGAAARLDELAQVVDSPLRQKGQGSDQAQANSPQRQEGPGSGQAQAEETMGRSRTHDVELDSDGRRKAEAKQVVMQALDNYWAGTRSTVEHKSFELGGAIVKCLGDGWSLHGTEPPEFILDQARFYHLRKDGCLSLRIVFCPCGPWDWISGGATLRDSFGMYAFGVATNTQPFGFWVP